MSLLTIVAVAIPIMWLKSQPVGLHLFVGQIQHTKQQLLGITIRQHEKPTIQQAISLGIPQSLVVHPCPG